MNRRSALLVNWLVMALMLVGCSAEQESPEAAGGTAATPVTVVAVGSTDVSVLEHTVGRIEAQTAPVIDAEVPGTIARVRVDAGQRVKAGDVLAELDTTDLELALRQAKAEVARLEALSSNQARTVQRYLTLRRQNNLSEGMLEEAQSQLKALQQQLDSARSQRATAQRQLDKATIKAPVPGQIQTRHVAPGDYVSVNAPLFQLAGDRQLRVHLPFPETVATRLKPGLTARLTAPLAPDVTVEQPIASLRPMLSAGSRAVEAVLFVDNPGGWAPGASVTAEVELTRRTAALMVPQISIVRRPAGTVVYVLNADGTVSQRAVTTGVNRSGQVEIRSGLDGSEQVVADGAGFLTDGARVQVREPS